MMRGLYTSAAGMTANMRRHEALVHNMSNAQTIGYKEDETTLSNFSSMLLERMGGEAPGARIGTIDTGTQLQTLQTNWEQGSVRLTEYPLDFALEGDGFFRVQTPEGERYTRDGRFKQDPDGRLTTEQGYPVLGANGELVLPEGVLEVRPNGEVRVDGAEVGQLSIARFDDMAALTKDGDTLFNANGTPAQLVAPEEVQVAQGYLEESNVDATRAMTEMMSVLRAYQASHRMVQFQDQINGQAVSEIGRV